jgi:hypothetical protein
MSIPNTRIATIPGDEISIESIFTPSSIEIGNLLEFVASKLQ